MLTVNKRDVQAFAGDGGGLNCCMQRKIKQTVATL